MINFTEIRDTPGCFYALGYALSASAILAQRFRGARHRLSRAGLLGALLVLTYFTRGVQNFVYVLSMLSIVALLCAAFLQAYTTPLRGLFYAVRSFLLGEFMASSVWLIYYNLALARPALLDLAPAVIVNLALYAVFMVAFIFVERAMARDEDRLVLTGRDLALAVMIAFSAYVTSNLGYIDEGGILSGSFARDIFVIRTLVDLSGVIMLLSFQRLLIEGQLRIENAALTSLRDAQYRSYQLTRQGIDLVNQKYHDLRHQIDLIRVQVDSEKARGYLDRMETSLRAWEDRFHTGSGVLDAILTARALAGRERGVSLRCMADGALLAFMDDMDVSALFGNVLDNAVAAAAGCARPERRLVRLTIARKMDFLHIHAENGCDADVAFRDGLPVYRGAEAHAHGYGARSIRRIAEKYSGSAQAELADGWYHLTVLIPLPDDFAPGKAQEQN